MSFLFLSELLARLTHNQLVFLYKWSRDFYFSDREYYKHDVPGKNNNPADINSHQIAQMRLLLVRHFHGGVERVKVKGPGMHKTGHGVVSVNRTGFDANNFFLFYVYFLFYQKLC